MTAPTISDVKEEDKDGQLKEPLERSRYDSVHELRETPVLSQQDDKTSKDVDAIMKVLETYFWSDKDTTGGSQERWQGKERYRQQAEHWIAQGLPIALVIPAFPFKSPNLDKVLSKLPDYGEFLGLQRLNQICMDVGEVYSPGARMAIISDGSVFNDLLYIDAEDVWNYSVAIENMIEENGWSGTLSMFHPMQTLGFVAESAKISKEDFLRTMNPCRERIMQQFCASDSQIIEAVEKDSDSRLTYMGFKAFCTIDMANSPLRRDAGSGNDYKRAMTTLARRMMSRNEGFSKLLRDCLPNTIRLSIHRSSGVNKLSICLIPQPLESVARSPWMCCIALDKDGTCRTAHVADIRSTHRLVHRNGQPWRYEQLTHLSLSEAVARRNDIFNSLWQDEGRDREDKLSAGTWITVSVITPEDVAISEENVIAGKMTPASFLDSVHIDSAIAAKVNGVSVGLTERLYSDCTVTFITTASEEGQQILRRSAALCLSAACEQIHNCLSIQIQLTEDGLFYDFNIQGRARIGLSQKNTLEDHVHRIIAENEEIRCLQLSKAKLCSLFFYNKYLLTRMEEMGDDESATVYRCASHVLLCDGPCVTNTGAIGAFKILQNSTTQAVPATLNERANRISAVAFSDKVQMESHLAELAEIEKYSHRAIGRRQRLFQFDRVSPGSAFLLPSGHEIFAGLQKLLRSKYRDEGFQEVQTPVIYDHQLWQKSGHWQHYQDDIFKLQVNNRLWALKPMNCPGHFIIFGSQSRSYRDLPLRLAEFGVLHRNEATGALHGMTRVRKLQQDDAHIFCTHKQIGSEVEAALNFFQRIYDLFHIKPSVKLSTRPEDCCIGEPQQWDRAESELRNALDAHFGKGRWSENSGDGAFYGPKIDISIKDRHKRDVQCATIQLDYQAAARFNLRYADHQGHAQSPVVIHRAAVGSFERFIGVLAEHLQGNWPLWLSPRQVLIVPTSRDVNEYAQSIRKTLRRQYKILNVAIDDRPTISFQSKIRRGHELQYNHIFVIGERERAENAANVRSRDDQTTWKRNDSIPLSQVGEHLKHARKHREFLSII